MFYYDQDGQPITSDEWVKAFEDTEGRRVADDYVGNVHVSTVWLGLDHGFGGPVPIIFETMVLGLNSEDDEHEYQWRYATKQGALAGHRAVLNALKRGELNPDWEMP